MDAIITGRSPLFQSPPISCAGPINIISGRHCCSTALTSPATKIRLRSTTRPKRMFGNSLTAQSGSRITLRCSAISEIGESEFQSTVLNSSRPVLVEFVATWCGPCRLISPAMESIAEEYEGRLVVVKIDHDANPGLIKEYEVYGLPTLILFKDGKEVPDSRREGAITKLKLKEYLDALLQTISVA